MDFKKGLDNKNYRLFFVFLLVSIVFLVIAFGFMLYNYSIVGDTDSLNVYDVINFVFFVLAGISALTSLKFLDKYNEELRDYERNNFKQEIFESVLSIFDCPIDDDEVKE